MYESGQGVTQNFAQAIHWYEKAVALDEPMAACDEDRSESLLGTIKSVNFKQTLLVSHDEISESIADNIILL